jgi:tetratricopeptide (TPR) repeat protein
MRIPLARTGARWSFLAGIVLVTCLFSFLAGKVWLAAHWDATSDPDRMLRAASLEPGNADYWDRLGFYEKWNFGQPDLRRAVVYDQRATDANPRSDTYWMDLADAYEAVGQPARAQQAFAKAQAVHPISSDVAWRYGNYLLRQGDYPQAFAELRRALITDPSLTAQAISECSKTSDDLPKILNEVLPDQNGYYLTALDYFLAQHQTDAALAVWDHMLALKPSAKMEQSVPLMNELIGQQRVGDALRVWREALENTGWPQDGGPSLVFNGGFEHDLLNGAFDWREDPVAGAAFSADGDAAHTGSRSLRITFDGSTNLDFRNLWEFLPVEPGTRYHFSAYLRLEGISTDSGIRFAINDAFDNAALQVLTPDLVASHPWSLVEADFVTGPKTHLLIIALRRVPSWKFDNKLRGRVWVDDVSLVPASGVAKENPR